MSALNELTRLSRHVFIGGEFRKSAAASLLDVGDPATEDKIGEIADTPEAEIAAAIAAANKAQKAWNTKNSLTRAELLHEAAHKMRALKAVLGEMMTREMGKPYKESTDEVEWAASGGLLRRSGGMKRAMLAGDRRLMHFTVGPWAWWSSRPNIRFAFVLGSGGAIACGNTVT
jgi:acyl-CoA reductase-like NAD-dependent aldehyde dehydrogenase